MYPYQLHPSPTLWERGWGCGGGDFPRAGVNGQVRLFAITLFVPLSRLRERGNALQGAPPCALHPSPTLWERGWG